MFFYIITDTGDFEKNTGKNAVISRKVPGILSKFIKIGLGRYLANFRKLLRTAIVLQ